jgi:hypothetical protein
MNASGWAEIDFNLDTIDSGSYLTVNISNLDDAAVVAVNGQVVFAGYPNSGPYYQGIYFDQAAFALNYSWQEKVNGNTYTFVADTKLLDHCPGGYSPTYQKTASNGTVQTNTDLVTQGFFCNSEGKFLMNRHEGNGTWDGSVAAQMPLKVGANTVIIYWGTAASGFAYGNITVTGNIYNVGTHCTGATWSDQCGGLEARAQ